MATLAKLAIVLFSTLRYGVLIGIAGVTLFSVGAAMSQKPGIALYGCGGILMYFFVLALLEYKYKTKLIEYLFRTGLDMSHFND